jgi:hypothetical protein
MRTLLFLATVILTVFSLTTKAQIKLDWATSSGGSTGNDNATSVAYDASGNVYTVGSFRGTVDFDPGLSTYTLASTGGTDAFIQKLDANGNFLAAYKIGGTLDDAINGVNIDASGNVYVAGYFRNTMDVDLGAGNSPLTTSTVQSCFVVKYTSTLTLSWARVFAGATAQFINSINVDTNGNVYTAGTVSAGTIDFDPNAGVSNHTVTTSALFLHKLSSTGTLVWAKGLNSTQTTNGAYSIDFDSNQNPVFVGGYTGTIDFDAGAGTNTLTTGSGTDINGYVCKYDAAGNHLFAFKIGYYTTLIGPSIEDRVKKVVIDNLNNIYVCGWYSGTTDFDPSAGTTNYTTISSTFSDGFVAKYSNTGAFLWANVDLANTGGERVGTGLSINPAGEIFVATTKTNVSNVIKIVKLNSAGIISYSKELATNAYCNDMQSTGATALLIAGNYNTTADFDPSYYTNNLTSNGAEDAFVAKYSECTTSISAGSLVGSAALCNGSTNTYSVASMVGALGYFWSNTIGAVGTSTTNVISLTTGQTATTGVVSITGYNYCVNNTQTLQVTVTPNTTVNVASSSSSVCAGNSVTLTASGTTSYSWASSGETTPSIVKNPTSTTIYTVTGYNGNCSNTKTVTVNVVGLPNVLVTVNQPTAGCAGSPVTLTASGATSYTWNTGVNTTAINVTPTVSTIYTVTGTSAAGCVKTTTAGVGIQSPVLAVSASAYSVCPGGVSTLSVSGAQSYTWNGPGGTTTGSIRNVSPTSDIYLCGWRYWFHRLYLSNKYCCLCYSCNIG